MARTKAQLRVRRDFRGGEYDGAEVLERVTETFTHRQTLDDGSVIYADPANHFWRYRGSSWYGEPPPAWDPQLAIECRHVHAYEAEVYY